MVVLRQKDQQATGDTDLCGKARSLGADGLLDHLHHQCLALENLLLDRNCRARPFGRMRRFAIGLAVPDIGYMQEGSALQPNVDKGGLHPRQHARHLAQVDVAHQPALQRALDVQFLHRATFHHRHTCFVRCPVDQDILLHGVKPISWSACAVSNKGKPMMPV